jgi:beta-glucuronidase
MLAARRPLAAAPIVARAPAIIARAPARVSALAVALAAALALALAPAAPAQESTGGTGTGTGGADLTPTAPPAPIAPPPVGPYRVETPKARALYSYGPSGRYLLGGTWLFRFDRGRGTSSHFERQRSTSGWSRVNVPNAWNASGGDVPSYLGTIGWYRKDFRVPGGRGATFIVRFESVNYRAKAWVNGHYIGSHAGAYQPWELQIPGKDLHSVNRLVVRVDSRRHGGDLPPGGVSRTSGRLVGGWWNYGGLLREVYLRRVDRVDMSAVQVEPDLPCPSCPGRVHYRVTLTNYSKSDQSVRLTSRFGSQSVTVGSARIKKGRSRTLARTLTVRHPRVWSPSSPNLYDVTLEASAGGGRVGGRVGGRAHYFLRTGIRSIRVSGGLLLINGRVANLRGVALHEDSPQYGFAVPNAVRDRWISEIQDIGATIVRAHYPLSPYFEEQADAHGILLWSEVPVYSVAESELENDRVRQDAVNRVRTNVVTNSSHPSVAIWSIANELNSKPQRGQIRYIKEAVHAAHGLDPTRPVAMAVQGYVTNGCQAAAYRPLAVIGLNDYFGWYPGPDGSIADRDLLSDWLDQERACYGGKALMVTELGAEANRGGPVDERGTYAFQSQFVDGNLAVFATKPWLAGAIYFAIEEFRVRPEWDGGNPRPSPPIHTKGLISFFGARKPAFFEVQRLYKATQQLR